MPVFGPKTAISRSESWRRGWDSNPGSLHSAVFKSGSGRPQGFAEDRFTRESADSRASNPPVFGSVATGCCYR